MGNNRKNDIAIDPRYPALNLLALEETLFLDDCPVGHPDASEHIKRCRDYLELEMDPRSPRVPVVGLNEMERIGVETDPLKDAIHVFSQLYIEALKIPKTLPKDIACVRLHYGFDDVEGKLKLMYEPVLITKVEEGGFPEITGIFQMKTVDRTKQIQYYKFNPGKQLFETAETVYKDWSDKYKDKIWIRHFLKRNVFGKHTHLTDDATCVIFPFQLIFSFIYENLGVTKDISIYNSIHFHPGNPGIQIKHSLLLSPDLTPLLAALKGSYSLFAGMFANLAHLCPPHRDFKFMIQDPQ